jgi:hypothetical protein|tara:strand:+ start:606 stop:1298 length:693 start_codon:yes stop_codon:yes gene_type:complete
MNESYNINSILNAIEDINTRPKKKLFDNEQSILKKINENNSRNDEILPTTEKIILEAERFSHKLKDKSLILQHTTEDILILNNEYNEHNLNAIYLEKIKLDITNDLYLSLSKKIKKNTLKIIVDLHVKIHDLEKEIDILNINNKEKISPQVNSNHSVEHFINESSLEKNTEHLLSENKENLTEYTIDTLKTQNLLIKKYEKSEEKLRLIIVDLEQDIFLLRNKKLNIIQD